MLSNLKISDIAIIKEAVIDFDNGLNVLTGETGAGKSIVIDSINAILGEKTSRELIRTGESSAMVNALFGDISDNIKALLEANGLPVEADGSLLLQRRLYKDGKNACRINGMNVTVSMLKSIGMKLINIHGQRDSQELLDAEKHIDFDAAKFQEQYENNLALNATLFEDKIIETIMKDNVPKDIGNMF